MILTLQSRRSRLKLISKWSLGTGFSDSRFQVFYTWSCFIEDNTGLEERVYSKQCNKEGNCHDSSRIKYKEKKRIRRLLSSKQEKALENSEQEVTSDCNQPHKSRKLCEGKACQGRPNTEKVPYHDGE